VLREEVLREEVLNRSSVLLTFMKLILLYKANNFIRNAL